MKLEAKNVRYNMIKKKIFFDSDDKEYEMEAKDVMELAYGVLDLFGLSYGLLDEVDYKLNGVD